MVTRIGHIALNVADLGRAVDFQRQVIGLVETERVGRTSYLTCNDRHHELILIEDPAHRGYDHLALQVTDGAALETARRVLPKAGGALVGEIYDGEPGIDRPHDRPTHFEHLSCKVLNHRKEEKFLTALGFTNSDRMGFMASWWHCDE